MNSDWPFDGESADGSESFPEARCFIPSIRASLGAKLERLLQQPVIGKVANAPADLTYDEDAEEREEDDEVFGFLRAVARSARPERGGGRGFNPWREDPNDGTCTVAIEIDYNDLWRGKEKEVIDSVAGTIENSVTFLTDAQRQLLERSPREFLALNPGPETAELLTYRTEMVGGVERVVELVVDELTKSPTHIRHIAIVPNLIPIERQLAALSVVEEGADDGPLGPLRVLLGLTNASVLLNAHEDAAGAGSGNGVSETLDEFQRECVEKALTTPHFAVIKGPPGSGKTTVITNIIRRALARGDRVLVVSPTHVAVDNVVEKLVPRQDAKIVDDLEKRSLPVRFAARPKKLLEIASTYWIGPKKQRRGATISKRVERCLSATVSIAEALYALEDTEASGRAPITTAVAGVHAVICGTPIGILSFDPVKLADPGTFGLLIVDEVSKMTLPEFLAIAVKARRWILVGDPEQLPPFNNIEENATTLDDVLDPALELVCSVGAILERSKPGLRWSQRVLVVTRQPERVRDAIRKHIAVVRLDNAPSVTVFDEDAQPGILLCLPDQTTEAAAFLAPASRRDRTHNPSQSGTVDILVERGLNLERPGFATGMRFIAPRMRSQALVFDNAFSVYHIQPWAVRARQKLRVVSFRNGLEKYLPSSVAIATLWLGEVGQDADVRRGVLIDQMAERFALNTVSVYDWLTGIPADYFDTSPLRELAVVADSLGKLREAVKPFVGTLKKQYRMRSSLSKVPRELFYFDEALFDGNPSSEVRCRVQLVQVIGDQEGEVNQREAKAILDMLVKLNGSDAACERQPKILVITPYKAQERLLEDEVATAQRSGGLDRVEVEVCTLDRCQGREAEFVFISLVRNRATTFMDAPKRWNVALTRAREGLFIFGDVDAFLTEASTERARSRGGFRGGRDPSDTRPMMSLLARILEAYDQQIHAHLSVIDARPTR